jgi:hypothetical protein
VSASSPDPRYYKDGNGLRPTWRLRLRHPVFSLRFTPLNRLRVRWNDRHYRKRPRPPAGITRGPR